MGDAWSAHRKKNSCNGSVSEKHECSISSSLAVIQVENNANLSRKAAGIEPAKCWSGMGAKIEKSQARFDPEVC
jgi:hypothetical protein